MEKDRVLAYLAKLTKQVESSVAGDDRARQDALVTCSMLGRTLETPSDAIVRMAWIEPSYYSAFKIASDLSLFEHLVADGAPKSNSQLAKMTNTDPVLTLRILRVLVSLGATEQITPDRFIATPLAKAMVHEMYKKTVNFTYDTSSPAYLFAPAYLANNGYQNPTDPCNCPVHSWFDTLPQSKSQQDKRLNYFEILEALNQSPGLAHVMSVWHDGRPHWSNENFYPVKERLIAGAKDETDAVFMVDVGGSIGTDLQKFLDRHPRHSFPGRLILQDLPEVINNLEPENISKLIEPMVHDFFTPQPIQGARAYFLHSNLHDHPDDRAILILHQIAKAMTPGYSKVLLWEYIVSDNEIAPAVATLDWAMMIFCAACERSESHWKRIIEAPEVGMKVTGIWKYSQFDQCVIEAMLA